MCSRILLVVVATGLFGLPNSAQAQVIYNSFGPNFAVTAGNYLIYDSLDPNIGDGTYGILARGFRTPAYATTLTQAVLPFLMDDPSAHVTPVRVSIWSGESFFNAGPPLGVIAEFLGQPLYSLPQRTVIQGGTPNQPTIFGYAPAAPVTLAPNTFYWLVADVTKMSNDEVRNVWFSSTLQKEYVINGFIGGFPYGTPYNLQDDKYGCTEIYTTGGFECAMRIDATAVPEPTSLLLVATGSMTAVFLRRRRQAAEGKSEPLPIA